MQLPKEFDRSSDAPVLIAGATASGKSALALELAKDMPSVIINADALQVYSGWQILTARPSDADRALVPHLLDGHIGMTDDYSVGHWLREVKDILQNREKRPIIIGGTGLYFRALTEGLADIPPIPTDTQNAADAYQAEYGAEGFANWLKKNDPKTYARIDVENPARTRRAWEVMNATKRSLTDWQDNTPAPPLPLTQVQALHLSGTPEWINERINRRFDTMIEMGALAEVTRAKNSFWDPALPSCQAIGAADLMAHLNDEITLESAVDAAKQRTRQFAKRQRTWFRARMRDWFVINLQ